MERNHPPPWPVTDLSPAAWIIDGIGTFDAGVGALVPDGYASYARLFHPAASPRDTPVTWAAVADWSGGVMHALAQFPSLSRPHRDVADATPPWDEEPRSGELPAPLLSTLCEVLADHTGTPERCWFCVWDGWTHGGPSAFASRAPADGEPGDVSPFPPEVTEGTRLRLPHRDYVVFHGPLDAAPNLGRLVGRNTFVPHSPNLFWPDDRMWCVATDVDLDSTYIGGSEALLGQLLDDPRLEVWPVAVTDPVTADSDRLNGR